MLSILPDPHDHRPWGATTGNRAIGEQADADADHSLEEGGHGSVERQGSTEDGTYVLAHQEGLELTRYLDRATVDRVRGLLPTTAGATTPSQPSMKRAKSAASSRPVRIAPSLELVDAMLP